MGRLVLKTIVTLTFAVIVMILLTYLCPINAR